MILHEEITFQLANSESSFEDAGALFREYAGAIKFEEGFKDFENELENLQATYISPNGALLLAYHNNRAIGCIGIQKVDTGIAELKRFYVKADFRKHTIGAKLLELILETAEKLDFKSGRLEVIPTLVKAKELYFSFGFHEVNPFKKVVLPGTTYMEKNLTKHIKSLDL